MTSTPGFIFTACAPPLCPEPAPALSLPRPRVRPLTPTPARSAGDSATDEGIEDIDSPARPVLVLLASADRVFYADPLSLTLSVGAPGAAVAGTAEGSDPRSSPSGAPSSSVS